jgi:hypothetical protein
MERSIVGLTAAMMHYSRRPPHSISPREETGRGEGAHFQRRARLAVILHDWRRGELATAADVPSWFIAAFEDGKDTPDFLAGYEIDLRAALDRAASC